MNRRKITLRSVGEYMQRTVFPNVGWVTLDMTGIRVFDNAGGADAPPTYDIERHAWGSIANTLLATLSMRSDDISTKGYCKTKEPDYSKCIECIDPTLQPEKMANKQKMTKHKSGVLAYFADGTTLRFDTKCEARTFFGFRRVEEVTRYIKTGNPLPDGSTTLDEALDDNSPSKPSDIQLKRKRKR